MGKAQAAQTHCIHGHEFTPENTRIKKGYRQCRECQRATGRARMRAGKLSRGQVERIFEALHEGRSLQSITGYSAVVSGRPTYVRGTCIASRISIKSFQRNNPLIGNRMQRLFDANAKACLLRASQTRRVIAARVLHRSDAFDIVTRVTARIPSRTVREEVRSAMWLAMAEGRLKAADIERRVGDFIHEYGKMFSPFVPVIGGYMGFLDMRLADGDNRTLHDQVTRGLWE
jgi:hypothetical protein